MELIVWNFFDAGMTSHVIGLSLCQCLTFNFRWNSWKKVHILTYRWLAKFPPTILAPSLNSPQKNSTRNTTIPKNEHLLSTWSTTYLESYQPFKTPNKDWLPFNRLRNPSYFQQNPGPGLAWCSEGQSLAGLFGQGGLLGWRLPGLGRRWTEIFCLLRKDRKVRCFGGGFNDLCIFTPDFCKTGPIWRAHFF